MSQPQSNCCAVSTTANGVCPVSAHKGRSVPRLTLESLLCSERQADIGDRQWFFCAAPSCEVVYFSDDGGVFDKDDLRVKVHQKEPGDGSTPVCYCFGHTPDSIAAEIERTGGSTLIAVITAEVKAGRCHCEDANPQGSCCLGNVSRAVKAARAQTAQPA